MKQSSLRRHYCLSQKRSHAETSDLQFNESLHGGAARIILCMGLGNSQDGFLTTINDILASVSLTAFFIYYFATVLTTSRILHRITLGKFMMEDG